MIHTSVYTPDMTGARHLPLVQNKLQSRYLWQHQLCLVSSLPRSRNMFSTQAVNMGVQGLLRYLVDQWFWLQTQLKMSTWEYKMLSDTWLINVFCGSGPASRCLKLHQLAPSTDLIQAGWCKLPNILGGEISCWFVLLHYIWEMDPLFFLLDIITIIIMCPDL